MRCKSRCTTRFARNNTGTEATVGGTSSCRNNLATTPRRARANSKSKLQWGGKDHERCSAICHGEAQWRYGEPASPTIGVTYGGTYYHSPPRYVLSWGRNIAARNQALRETISKRGKNVISNTCFLIGFWRFLRHHCSLAYLEHF